MPGGWIARRLALLAPVVFAAALVLLTAGCGSSGGTDYAAGIAQAGPGMMGYVPGNEAGPVRSLAATRRQADRFGEALSLHAGEVMQFTNGFYAELLDADGEPATEVLIDPGSGAVWIEYGPAMMWNTRYGMMGSSSLRGRQGMMGGMFMMGSGGMMGGSDAGRPLPGRPHLDAFRRAGAEDFGYPGEDDRQRLARGERRRPHGG